MAKMESSKGFETASNDTMQVTVKSMAFMSDIPLVEKNEAFCHAKQRFTDNKCLTPLSIYCCSAKISSTFIEAPCSKLRGIFDRKEVCHFQIVCLQT
jgi:hypothetical protein